ncbi:MAG: response regulator transcription factor [Actinomycetota bacterium]|nr:response regulator transcription factor [Actinomycetota bacterium]
MSPEQSVAQSASKTASARSAERLRVAIIDRDSGFMQVLAHRLEALGREHRMLASAVPVESFVAMRANALVVDLSVVPDGWRYLEDVCGRSPGLAVVVCTAPSSVAQRVRGLRLGVDAWLTKPCHHEELICVIEAAVRRHRRSEMPSIEQATQVGEITVRPDLYQAYVSEVSIELTAREFEILQLLSRSSRVLRREEIYERVWGYAMAHGDRSVDVFVRKLRQKLRSASPGWSYIHTHFGVGYRLLAEPEIVVDDPRADHDADHDGHDDNGARVERDRSSTAETVVDSAAVPELHPSLTR